MTETTIAFGLPSSQRASPRVGIEVKSRVYEQPGGVENPAVSVELLSVGGWRGEARPGNGALPRAGRYLGRFRCHTANGWFSGSFSIGAVTVGQRASTGDGSSPRVSGI